MPTKQSQPNAARAFSAWAKVRMDQKPGGLSAKSVEVYGWIWESWGEWLASRNLEWQEAQSSDVREFLEHIEPARANGGTASTVTQARYARILKAIYAHAVTMFGLQGNPVDRPALASHSEVHDSRVFHRGEWDLLVDGISPDPARWQSVRDASVLLTVMNAALTVSEIRGLNLGDVAHHRMRWVGGRLRVDPTLLPAAPGDLPAWLTIVANERREERSVPLYGRALDALLAWLQLRAAMPGTTRQHPVFVSRKRPAGVASGDAAGGRLSAKTIFMLARDHAHTALAPLHGSEALGHCGPMQFRSSCIVRWLEAGEPEDEVVARAGLSDLNSLRRLRSHVWRVEGDRAQSQGSPT